MALFQHIVQGVSFKMNGTCPRKGTLIYIKIKITHHKDVVVPFIHKTVNYFIQIGPNKFLSIQIQVDVLLVEI